MSRDQKLVKHGERLFFTSHLSPASRAACAVRLGAAHGPEEEGGAAEGQLEGVHPTLAGSVVRGTEDLRIHSLNASVRQER